MRIRFVIAVSMIFLSFELFATTRDNRVLHGHVFVPTKMITEPFLTRDYDMFVSGGLAKGSVLTDSGTVELRYLATALDFYTQQPIANTVSLTFNFSAMAGTGSDAPSAFVFGANGSIGAGGTLKVKGYQNKNISIAPFAGFGWNVNVNVNPGVALTKVIYDMNNGIMDPNQLMNSAKQVLSNKENEMEIFTGISFAFSISKYFGFLSEIAYEFDKTNESTHNFYLSGVISAGYPPIGITTGYSFLRDLSNSANTHQFEIGAYYMVKKEFSIGLIFDYGKYTNNVNVYAGQFGMRFTQ